MNIFQTISSVFSIATLLIVVGILIYLHNRHVAALSAEKNLLERKFDEVDASRWSQVLDGTKNLLNNEIENLKDRLGKQEIEVADLNTENERLRRDAAIYDLMEKAKRGALKGPYDT